MSVKLQRYQLCKKKKKKPFQSWYQDGDEGQATPALWRHHGNTEGSYQGHLFIGEKEKNSETSGENKCNLNVHVFAPSPAERI